MRYAIFFKVSTKLLLPGNAIIFKSLYDSQTIHRRLSLLKKGTRLMNAVVMFGDSGTDFRDNIKTCATEYDAYKVPRIVSNLLLGKRYKRRA